MLADVTLNLQSPFLFLLVHLAMAISSGLFIIPCIRKADGSDSYVGGVIIACVVCGANLIMVFVMSWQLFEKALKG